MDKPPDWMESSNSFAEDIEEPRRWTPIRIIYLVIVLITLIAFLLYTIAPILATPPPPPPITLPRQQA